MAEDQRPLRYHSWPLSPEARVGADLAYRESRRESRHRARLLRRRPADRRYEQKPEVKAKKAEYLKAWKAAHIEERRAYNREWMRRYRAQLKEGAGR